MRAINLSKHSQLDKAHIWTRFWMLNRSPQNPKRILVCHFAQKSFRNPISEKLSETSWLIVARKANGRVNRPRSHSISRVGAIVRGSRSILIHIGEVKRWTMGTM